MSGDLPAGWVETTLGDVVNYGKTQKINPCEIGLDTWVLELEDIEKDTSRIIKQIKFSDRQSKSTKNIFKKHDVLYGKLRPYLNKIVIAKDDGVCTTEVIPLSGNCGIEYRYLFYALKRPEFLEYVKTISHGIDMPRLGTIAGKEALFILAPLNEQKRIADKLDTVLAAVGRVKSRLEKVETLLKRFRQSVLNAATTGKLTEEWRAAQGIEDEWDEVKLGDLIEHANNGISKRRGEVGDFLPVLRLADFVGGIRVKGKERQILLTEKEREKYLLNPSDLLVVRVNGSRELAGKFILYTGYKEAFCDHFIRLSVAPNKVLPLYLTYVANTGSGRDYIESVLVTSAGQNTINQTSLFSLKLRLPCLEEQREIVSRVERLFVAADRIEERLGQTRKRVERLESALLAKAFRGELVLQDPSDEPASELLKRIKAERAEADQQAKPRRCKRAG